MTQKLLFLPGLLCNQRLFQAQIDAFVDSGFTCAVADLSGADSIAALADSVARQHFQDANPWHVVALSMGGYVAFELLARHSAKIAKLVLFNTSARADTPEQRETRAGLINLAKTGRFKGVTPRLLPRLLSPKSLDDASITNTVQAMAAEVGRDAFIRQQTAIMQRPDRREFLRGLPHHTLIIGGQQDQISTHEIINEINILIPNSHLITLDNVGHLSPLENPVATNHNLLEFITKAS